MADLLLYYFCLKNITLCKRRNGINNIFGVNFVHCAEWLKQIEKENWILLVKLFQEYTILKI